MSAVPVVQVFSLLDKQKMHFTTETQRHRER